MTVVEAITAALHGIKPEQVHHPYHGFQERVFCYELYHCLRALEEAGELDIRPARLQAELNKGGMHYFRQIVGEAFAARCKELTWRVPEAAPDLLMHEPSNGPAEKVKNVAVLEVKLWGVSDESIRWDLAKLAFFSAEPLAYDNRIFVVINGGCDAVPSIITALKKHDTGGEEIAVCIWTPNGHVEWEKLRFSRDVAIEMFESAVRAREERRERRAPL